jgi:hypothetical protein
MALPLLTTLPTTLYTSLSPFPEYLSLIAYPTTLSTVAFTCN